MSSLLENNITNLQTILEQIDSLPEAGGEIKLPVLANEGVASDLASGKQLINSNGDVVTGTHVCQNTGVTVQRKTGTLTSKASSSGVTVNCGFKPDFVTITENRTQTDEDTNIVYDIDASFNFMDSDSDNVSCMLWTRDDIGYDILVTRTNTGFKASFWKYNYDFTSADWWGGKTFTYHAYKIT